MLLLDLTHTSHTGARTGIQRVARALRQNLGSESIPVTHDPFLGAWRALEPWECVNLTNSQGGKKRRARWPASAKWRGHLRRITSRTATFALHGNFDGLIEPEIFSPPVAHNLPKLFSQVSGPRVALFLDAIPLRFPELTPPGTVARFPGYLRELLQFDGIAAISEESRESLLGYWHWLGIRNPPPVAAISLGVDSVARAAISEPQPDAVAGLPVVLSVGTLEGRKNHLALLEACEKLWAGGARFELHLIGHVNAATGQAALSRARALQTAGRPLRYDGPATDEKIDRAYATCAFTVYPSIAEGFGLPVIESLAHGKPCVCSARGALGESARDGGCLALDAVDAASLAQAITRLLAAPDELAALATAAGGRTFKTRAGYTRELTTWMTTLPRR